MVASTPRNFAVNSARLTNLSCGGPCANTNGSGARAGLSPPARLTQIPLAPAARPVFAQLSEGGSTIPAYLIGQVTVHDPAGYQKYLAGFADAFAPFEGRVLVATENVEVLEGTWPRPRTVVLEFPSMAHA